MSSNTHYNRLRRLSNTIEVKSRTTTYDESRLGQSIKLPALNSINKSIKYNDLSFTVSKDLNKLRKQPEISEDINEVSAHCSLLSIRKRYDVINKQREVRQAQIRQLEQEKEKYQIQKNKYVQEKSQAEKQVKSKQLQLKTIKNLNQQQEMNKKVMLSIINRFKRDKIIYDQRKYNLEKEFLDLSNQKNIILKQNSSNKEQEDRTMKVYNKLIEHFQAQEKERNLHIHSIETMIEEKQLLQQNNAVRQVEIKEIAENTLQDKDQQQKRWSKVYLCHKFVQRILTNKINSEMNKFSTVEVAFKNIKTSTGVNTAEDLVQKFLNKQTAYGLLLGKISQNEKNISDLKNQYEALSKERTNLKSQKSILISNKTHNKQLSKQQKQYLFYSEKSTKCKLYQQKIIQWINKNNKKFNHFSIKNIQSQSKEQVLSEKLTKYLQRLLDNLEEAKSYDGQCEIKSNQPVQNSQNIRIKLKLDEQKQAQNHKYNQQSDFLIDQREQMHRDNQKFMKEIKLKYEQIKKTRLEAEPKKKQSSPQKAKPQVEGNI